MRVLNLMKTSVGGNWAVRQMRELRELGVDARAILPGGGPALELCRRYGIPAHFLETDAPIKRPWQFPKRIAGLKKLVKHLRPDIVHSHFVGTTLTMRAALRGQSIPRIFQVPGPLHLEHPFFRNAEIKSAGRQDHWIATCEATRKIYIDSGIDGKRIHFSYYGIDTGGLIRRKKTEKLRTELGLSNKKIIGMLAYMYPPKRILNKKRGIKGHEDVIDAVSLLNRSGEDYHVVFVGGAWNGALAYEKSIRKYADEKISSKAFFLGSRNDVPELYPDFDVAVHPSHSENLGGAAESLLMEVPTIATNVGGFPDIVKPGRTGYLTPPCRPDLLADAIHNVFEHYDEAKQFARQGKTEVQRMLDTKKTAENMLKIYQKIFKTVSERKRA